MRRLGVGTEAAQDAHAGEAVSIPPHQTTVRVPRAVSDVS